MHGKSITRSQQGPDETPAEEQASNGSDTKATGAADKAGIIWTPRFIVIVALIVVVGLSAASVITQGWTNHYYPSGMVLMIYTVPIFVAWLVLLKYAHSPWLRAGAISGGVWTVLTWLYYWLNFYAIDPHQSIPLYLQAASRCALLLTYICLSLAYTPLRRWDALFFRFAPLVLVLLFAVQLAFRLSNGRVVDAAEQLAYTEVLYFSVLVLWARPSCWRSQPGPTFLFGLIPFTQIVLTISPSIQEEVKFFFTQVSLLIMFIGILRLLQCELRH